ncbi:MAG: hypothetical protein AMXMBFR44_0500 [Candidatus Campbellbacteria bacterium]
MNKTVIWGLIIIAAVLGIWYFSTTSEAPEAQEPVDGSVSELQDGTYELATTQSSIEWTGSKTLIKDYYDTGTLAFSNGSVSVSGGAIVDGAFTVDMNSFAVLSTSNTKVPGSNLAGHLKSADFFDIATYPTATIDLVSVVDGTVTADVTIKGITKQVTFPAVITQEGNTITASAQTTIDRTLWDIRYGSSKFFGELGDNVINDNVDLKLSLVATKTQ